MRGFIAALVAIVLAGTSYASGYRQVVRTVVRAPAVQYTPACGVQQAPIQYAPIQRAPIQYAPSCGVQQAPVYVPRAPVYAPTVQLAPVYSYGVRQRFVRQRVVIQRRVFVPRQQRVIVERQRVVRRRR